MSDILIVILGRLFGLATGLATIVLALLVIACSGLLFGIFVGAVAAGFRWVFG